MRSIRAACGYLFPSCQIVVTLMAAVAARTASDARGDSPFATSVVSYVAGTGAVAGFNNPNVALGAPERFTGEGLIPQAVTPFQPAFRPNEVVSLGVGGRLVLAFDHDVVDGAVRGVGAGTLGLGRSLRGLQTGFVRSYAFGIGLGAVALVVFAVVRMSL